MIYNYEPIKFEVECSSMTPIKVDSDILKMKVFPFSFLENAKDWLFELAHATVTSWESMKKAFLEKFFPTSRVILLRKTISGIEQGQRESFPTYYEELLPLERQMLDASAGGALVDKTPVDVNSQVHGPISNIARQVRGRTHDD